MVSHYAASLTFDDALKLYKVVNNDASLAATEMVQRHTRSVSFQDSLKFYKAPLS